jgi:hypothetical protein
MAGLLIKKRQALKQPNCYQFVLFEKRPDWQNNGGHQTGHETRPESGHRTRPVNNTRKPDLIGRESDRLWSACGQSEHERRPESGHEIGHLYKQNENKENNKKAYGEFKTVCLSDDTGTFRLSCASHMTNETSPCHPTGEQNGLPEILLIHC